MICGEPRWPWPAPSRAWLHRLEGSPPVTGRARAASANDGRHSGVGAGVARVVDHDVHDVIVVVAAPRDPDPHSAPRRHAVLQQPDGGVARAGTAPRPGCRARRGSAVSARRGSTPRARRTGRRGSRPGGMGLRLCPAGARSGAARRRVARQSPAPVAVPKGPSRSAASCVIAAGVSSPGRRSGSPVSVHAGSGASRTAVRASLAVLP